MSWDLIIDRQAKKDLKRMPRDTAKRLLDAVTILPADPYAGDIEKIKGEERMWRRRIGAYRIIYDVSARQKLIRVYEIKRKTSSTY